MQKILVLCCFLFSTFFAAAQNSANDSLALSLFKRALQCLEKEQPDSAIIFFKTIVDEKMAMQTQLYGNAFYNIPSVYYSMEKTDKAKEWFEKVLNSDLKDNDETGSLMEPHTNYKHKSALALASLAQNDKNYALALSWVLKADTLYRYWGFEGSSTNVSKKQANLLEWKMELFGLLNKNEEATKAVISELICADRLTGFFKREQMTFLENIKKKSVFKKELDKALSKTIIKTIDKNNWSASFVFQGLTYIIPISNTYPDGDIPHYWQTVFIQKTEEATAEMFVKTVKSCDFYKNL
jgi:tetratricopeptide (TPR) repeat protein